MELLHLRAKNTPNGNPNRCYVLLDNGHVKGAWDEGYRGYSAVPKEVREVCKYPVSISTSATEVREFLKMGREIAKSAPTPTVGA